jgi:acetyl esterase/lipase
MTRDEALFERIDPGLRAAYEARPALDLTDLDQARSVNGAAVKGWPVGPSAAAQVAVIDRIVPRPTREPAMRIREYRPAHRAGPAGALLWLHGGGHVMGSVEQDDHVLNAIVAEVGCSAFSVDWRRAPEHPYPAEIDDAYTALEWLTTNVEVLDVDPRRIAVGGGSSGGGSAAGLALMVRDRGEDALCFQLLVYPMLDDRTGTTAAPAPALIHDSRLWSAASNRMAWSAYLRDCAGDVSPYAAPARAESLAGLPPAALFVGDLDLFYEETLNYSQRLVRWGVPTELHAYAGCPHGFDRVVTEGGPDARARSEIIESVRRALASTPR